jgi:hypothetical protein
MSGEEYIYSIILLGILGYMLILYLHDTTTHQDSVLIAEKRLSTASAFWFYFAAFFFLLVFWLLVMAEHALEQRGIDSGLPHGVVHLPRVAFGWLANLSLLMTAIAYSGGQDFNPRKLIGRAGVGTTIMFLWALLWEIVGHQSNLFWTSLLIAPELALANIAMVFLGWTFFVRWSGFSTLYFTLAIVYALLQLPAYLQLELDTFFKGNRQLLATLDIAFPLLAACQVMLAYGFLSLLRRSTVEAVEIDKPKYWPSGSRKVANWASPNFGGKWARLAVDLAFAVALAAVMAVLMHVLVEKYGLLL